MTFSDLERCNNPYFAFLFTKFDSFAYYVTVVEDRPIFNVLKYCLPFLAKTNAPCSAVSL